MGKFNLDDHYIYYYGQESHRRNEVALTVNKRFLNAVLECNFKNDRMISIRFQGKTFNMTVIQVYAPTTNAEEAEVEQFYEDLLDLLELILKIDVLYTRDDSTHGHHQMVNTGIRLIMFFAVKDGEALQSQ